MYPEQTQVIVTDIRLDERLLQPACDLIVRGTFDPATSTLSVAVHRGDIPGGGAGTMLAHRVILTGKPTETAPCSTCAGSTPLEELKSNIGLNCNACSIDRLPHCSRCGEWHTGDCAERS